MSIQELTIQELSKLSREEFETSLRLELAEAGIPLPRPEPIAPEPPKEKPDFQMYLVGSYYFKNEKDAIAVRDLINSKEKVYTSGYGKSERARKPYSYESPSESVNTRKIFSESLWEKVEAEFDSYTKREERYTSELSKWKQEKKLIDEFVEVREQKWEEAQNWLSEKERLIQLFYTYLPVAKNDRQIAMGFLLKISPYFERTHPEIVKNLKVGPSSSMDNSSNLMEKFHENF